MHPPPAARPTPDPGLPQPAVPQGRPPYRKILLIGGAVLTGVSVFLPWVQVVLLGDVNLIQAIQTGQDNAGWFFVLLIEATAICALTAAFRPQAWATRVLAVIAGGLSVYFGIRILAGAGAQLAGTDGLASLAIGPYAQIAGCVLLVAGACLRVPRAGRQPGDHLPPPPGQPSAGPRAAPRPPA
jgi:hypothetical protein